MTTSEVKNFEQQPQESNSQNIEDSSSSSREKMLILKIIEVFLVAALVSSCIILLILRTDQKAVLAGTIMLTISVFLFLINRQVFQDSKKAEKQVELTKKAELYTYLLTSNSSGDINTLIPARQKALQYCQELMDDYKKTRSLSRNLYYILQISTVILSGVTPILVLVDKLEAGQTWLKWLPVICPAIASIVASIVTSFPFQKNWLSANTTVELLEAEQEKFILGVTQLYRCYDVTDEAQKQQKASQALEQFIIQVNNIHLQQVQQSEEKQQLSNQKQQSEKTETDQSNEPKKEQS